MDEQLREHFALESLTINPRRPHSDPEQQAMKILEENVKNIGGRYETSLLWKRTDVKLPYNYNNALKRLHNTENKIDKHPNLKEKYAEQIEAMLQKGYAEKAPTTCPPGRTWYLPHFAVVNPMKPDKVRIVHDAAAKTAGVSLNDHLLTGPDLLQSLPGVMMRFREHQVAVSADIAEMFMQVKISETDRDALRFLWRGNRRTGQPDEYRMTSLIFGAACSPATAIFVKNHNAARFKDSHPEAVTAIVDNHYVDDYIASYKTEEAAIATSKKVREIHMEGGFQLKQWKSSSPAVLRELQSEQEINSQPVQLGDGMKIEKILGLIWNPRTDELGFNLDLARIPANIMESRMPTKRETLKIMMSLFDPLGLASPVTIRAKQIVQEVWRRGTEWDTSIDTDLAEKWTDWVTKLKELGKIAIPRCYSNYSTSDDIQLHVFVDASENAYSAVLYWRVTDSGCTRMSLITAKARVAPLKVTSIPRLELQAAVLGARIAATVIEEHTRKPKQKFFWTDSRTVLAWLRNGSRSYKPFVAHRIAAIEDLTTVGEWRWVPTAHNVADDSTRDVPSNFDANHRWFTDPEFLLSEPEYWPIEETTTVIETGEEKVNTARVTSPAISEAIPDPERFSKWERLLRTTARVLQFIQLCHRRRERVHYKRNRKNDTADPDWRRPVNKQRGPQQQRVHPSQPDKYITIESSLLREAEKLLVRLIQTDAFPDDIKRLQLDKPVHSSSRLYALSTHMDNGIIRITSRIAATPGIGEQQKRPAIIDGQHRVAKLWIQHIHRSLHHAGVETTVNECRQQYWILRMRPTVRKIVHDCRECRARRSIPAQPPTGNHPTCRLAHHQRPFTCVGLDYFGPINVSVGRTRQKRYVALFTCLTVRAVHLEIAATLNTDSAIMALRRMIARRGCPSEIWSDNGTNLRGADRELSDHVMPAIEGEANRRQIDWRFIPPGAPFMGGAWERLVRSCKAALSTTLHKRYPTDEVLATLIAEVEYTVNSRPLTHVSVDIEDPEALTPNHFLLGGSGRAPAMQDLSDRELVGRPTWRSSQRLADLFWSRWMREYLPELQCRRQPHGRGEPPKIGDIVLVADNNLPRNTWPRGIVIKTYPGRDSVVRVIDVRTAGGVLRRSTKKVIVLPTSASTRPVDESCNSKDADSTAGECSGSTTFDQFGPQDRI